MSIVAGGNEIVHASEKSKWHAVAVVRKGNTLWIFNLEYLVRKLEDGTPVKEVRGIVTVHTYLLETPAIKHCFMTRGGRKPVFKMSRPKHDILRLGAQLLAFRIVRDGH